MTLDGTTNGESVRQQLETYVAQGEQWVTEAVDILGLDTSVDPRLVLPEPMKQGEPRREAATPELTAESEASLRIVAGRFGIGGEQDVTLESAGIPDGHVRMLEGGLVWKIAAEAQLESDAGTIVYVGSPYRKTNDKEHAFERERLGVEKVSETEYQAARNVAVTRQGFEPLERELVLPFGYDINNGHQLVQSETGQLVQIGKQDGKPVLLLRVDRENYKDEENKDKYRNQPDTAALMAFVSDVLSASGDTETGVGMVTSTTYASRAIDAMRAGLSRERHFAVAMYGRQTLADVKNEVDPETGEQVIAAPTELMQIPGELWVAYDKLQLLKQALQQPE